MFNVCLDSADICYRLERRKCGTERSDVRNICEVNIYVHVGRGRATATEAARPFSGNVRVSSFLGCHPVILSRWRHGTCEAQTYVRMLMTTTGLGKRGGPRLSELASRGQRESGGGPTFLPSPVHLHEGAVDKPSP